MRRREFLAALSGAAVWPLAALAQQLPVIGLLSALSQVADAPRVEALVRRLRELGWIDGRTVKIEYRSADGRLDGVAQLATELSGFKPKVIVTAGAGPVLAAQRAAPGVPIVFAIASDPVGTGIVASLAHPGGDITGLSYLGPDLAAKRLEFAREMLPALATLAIMPNREAPGAMLEARELQATAGRVGVTATTYELRGADRLDAVFAGFLGRCDAVYVPGDPLVNSIRSRIIALALDARLPTIFGERENVDAGGLMSYGPNVAEMYRRAAELVDKIMRGAKPADLPVEQPTKFELVFNIKTARTIGVTVPPTLLARADEVIE